MQAPSIDDLAPDGRYLEWITNLKSQKHGVGEPYSVQVFLGQISSPDSREWALDANHVGTFTVLGDSQDIACEKCVVDQANKLQVTGQVPLTIALLERYLAREIDGLTPEIVVPYLQKNLHWRVIVVSLECVSTQLSPRKFLMLFVHR